MGWVTVLAIAVGAPAAARAQLVLSMPTNLAAHPGDMITIPVTLTETGNVLDATHGNGIATVGFAISYNPSLGTVPGSAVGLGSLISNPNYNFPPYSANANESAGQIRTFSDGTPGTPGLPSGTTGPVAEIALTIPVGIAPNSYTLAFDPVIGATTTTFVTDNNFTTYDAGSGLTLTNGTLTVTPVPEPGGLLLVGLVVTVAGVVSRRRTRWARRL
jgi:hypothetical protein